MDAGRVLGNAAVREADLPPVGHGRERGRRGNPPAYNLLYPSFPSLRFPHVYFKMPPLWVGLGGPEGVQTDQERGPAREREERWVG